MTEIEARLERRSRIVDRLRELLIDRLRVPFAADEIDPDVPLFGTGLGLDSVDAVELVVNLEALFGLKLAEGAGTIRTLRTLSAVVDAILAMPAEERS